MWINLRRIHPQYNERKSLSPYISLYIKKLSNSSYAHFFEDGTEIKKNQRLSNLFMEHKSCVLLCTETTVSNPPSCISQNKLLSSIISFGYVDSYAKIFLILYPPLENSTTRIAVIYNCSSQLVSNSLLITKCYLKKCLV